MSKRFPFRLSFLVTASLMFFIACENEDYSMTDNECSSEVKFIIPKENKDTTVQIINTFEDLKNTLEQPAAEREQSLLNKGWIKIEDEPESKVSLKGRRQVRTDTVYVLQETVDSYSDPSLYANFNAKFSKVMVDSINRFVAPEYRISTNKTYVCRWKLYGTYYNAEPGEQVAARQSPLCALHPDTKKTFTERGYSLYLHQSDKLNQYQMDSFQLCIQWENVSHKTIILDITWPFFPTDNSGVACIGYQFIYAVSKRI